jgi:hypothetical protein
MDLFLVIQYTVFVSLCYLFLIKKSSNGFYRFFRIVFLIILMAELSHGVYFTLKHIGKQKLEGTLAWEKQKAHLNTLIKACKENNVEPVLVTNGYAFMPLAVFNNVKIINQLGDLEKGVNSNGKRILLILIKRKNNISDKTPFDNFVNINKLKETRIDDITYYTHCLNCSLPG